MNTNLEGSNPYRLGIEQVRSFLPHRQPFLLVDRILEIHPSCALDDPDLTHRAGTRVVGLKNVTYNEPFFRGHFPEFAIMPGVLLVETMGQAASFSIYPYLEAEGDTGKVSRNFQIILVGVDNTRFRKPVVPGDTLRLESTVTKCRGRIWTFHCEASVEGQKVAEADLMANMITNAEPIL